MSSRTKLWLNVGRTCNLSLGNLAMGFVSGITGVALLDLAEIYGTSIASLSYLLTSFSVGGLIGSLLGGKLHDTYNTQLVSIFATAGSSIAVTMIPLSGILPLAHVAIFLCGVSVAAFLTGANIWLIRMWTDNSSPALQVFHLAFGIGGLVGPFIARPFLSNNIDNGNATASNTTEGLHLTRNHVFYQPVDFLELSNSSTAQNSTSESHVYCAYDNVDFKPSKPEGDSPTGTDEPRNIVRFTRIVLAIMCLYIGAEVAFEVTTSQMVASFAVKSQLHFSKSLAARLESAYYLSFAAGRLTASLATIKLPVFWVLVSVQVILLPTAVTLVVLGSSSSTVLWICITLVGFGQGPIYAAIIAWTSGHITLTNKMMALVAISDGIGSMIAPVVVGQFLDRDANVFLYALLMTFLLGALIFTSMSLYLRSKRHRSEDKQLLVNEDDSEQSDKVQ
ncbi:hypothetical protein HPB50_020531 [Hyalomma asiaticum]|uniref:Uncharacterized protein n=1 Tax=Hyalomma asiaticum TaxID=266040 RepID=A0ACB7T8V8_HYAAI|nr:hypothetical protein HPB50_020531 [Hyalomma asiaticum]